MLQEEGIGRAKPRAEDMGCLRTAEQLGMGCGSECIRDSEFSVPGGKEGLGVRTC